MVEGIGLYRRNGKKVYIKQPTLEELELTAKLWSDPMTMNEIGGVYNFTEDKRDMFYKKMVYPTDGKNFYCHVYNCRDKFIGEVSFHGYDSLTKAARINVKIHHRQRNKGYGSEAIKLLLEHYFLDFRGESIIDTTEIFGGKRLLSKCGFESIALFKEKETFKITKERFLNYRPESIKNVVIVGYDEMKDLYYSLINEIFIKANKVAGEEKFIVSTISENDTIVCKGKLIKSDKSNFNINFKPDILVIPGGKGSFEAVKNKEVIRFILSNYDSCDYLLAIEKSVVILNRCRMLEGITIPVIEGTRSTLEESNIKRSFSNKSFEDFGKIMISADLIGAIKGCLTIVRKTLGDRYFKMVEKELGI